MANLQNGMLRNNLSSLKIGSYGWVLSVTAVFCILFVYGSDAFADTPIFSDNTKLRWFNSYFNPSDAIPRQNLVILLEDKLSPKLVDSCKAFILPKDSDYSGKSLITRDQLMQGVLVQLALLLYQRHESAVFADLPATYAGLTAVDWFFRSGLAPADWGKSGTLDVFRPLTYADAAEFTDNLKNLVSAERPPFAISYVPTLPPPSAATYFTAQVRRDKNLAFLDLTWKGPTDQKPESIDLNLASWGLLSRLTVYDDGTYGDQKENDGVFGIELNAAAVPKQSAYIDVIFNLPKTGEVYGRLNLP